MVVSLVLMFIVGLQSLVVMAGSSMLEDTATADAAALGVLIALLFLIGGAFSLGVPTVSLVSFVLAGLIGILAGMSSSFTDLTYWGVVGLILAVLSYFGRREKRRRRSEAKGRVT